MTCDVCGEEIEGRRLYKANGEADRNLGVFHPNCAP